MDITINSIMYIIDTITNSIITPTDSYHILLAWEVIFDKSLLTNDVITIKFTKELCSKGDHWMILTNDKTLVNVSKECANEAWITSPYLFLDMVEMTKPMDERKVLSLVHSVAKYSESTLAVGARIIDKIVFYASDKMQHPAKR